MAVVPRGGGIPRDAGLRGGSLPPDDPGFAAQFGDLPRLTRTSNLKLIRELRQLNVEESIPSQLMTDAKPFAHWVRLNTARQAPDARSDTAIALASALTRGKVKRLIRESHELFPKRFPPWPEELRKLARRRMENDDARVRFRKAMRLPKCDFGVEFNRGLLADFLFVDYVRVGADLESYYAVEALSHGDCEEALESAESILIGARRLMEARHPTPRLAASSLHQRALWILRSCAESSKASQSDARRCLDLVHKQLELWPDERDVWVADRSDGLHAFEMIRQGYVLSVLSAKEFEKIEREIGLDRFHAAVSANIDVDELFYLQATRRLIDGCERPYSERIGVFEEIAEEMGRLRTTEEHPMLSDWILLSHVQIGHRELALDLARMQAMSLALCHLLNLPNRDYSQNPLTGLAYRIENDRETVRVFGVGHEGDDEPVVIRRAVAQVGKLP